MVFKLKNHLISFFFFFRSFIAELSRARSARSGAPWVTKLANYPSEKIGYDVAYAHPYTHLM